MADAIQTFQDLVPAGRQPSTPGGINCPLGPSLVSRISITWPPGCGGLVGVQVRAGGGFAFPNMNGQFLAFDDYTYTFDVTGQVNNGNWSIDTYNVDLIDHQITIVFEYDYLRGTGNANALTPVAL